MTSLERNALYHHTPSMQLNVPQHHHTNTQNLAHNSASANFTDENPKGTVRHPAIAMPKGTYDGHLVFSGLKQHTRHVDAPHLEKISSSPSVSAPLPPLLIRDLVCPRCTEMFDSYVERSKVIAVKPNGEEEYDANEGLISGIRSDNTSGSSAPADVSMNKGVNQSVGGAKEDVQSPRGKTHRLDKGTRTSSVATNHHNASTHDVNSNLKDITGESSPSATVNAPLTSSYATPSVSELYARQQHHESVISALSTAVSKQGKQLEAIQELLMSLKVNRQAGDINVHHFHEPVNLQGHESPSRPAPNLTNSSHTSTPQLNTGKVLLHQKEENDKYHHDDRGAMGGREPHSSLQHANSFRLVTASTGICAAEEQITPLGSNTTTNTYSPTHGKSTQPPLRSSSSSTLHSHHTPTRSTTSPGSPTHYYSDTDNNFSTIGGKKETFNSVISHNDTITQNNPLSVTPTGEGTGGFHSFGQTSTLQYTDAHHTTSVAPSVIAQQNSIVRDSVVNDEENDKVKSVHTHQYPLRSPQRDQESQEYSHIGGPSSSAGKSHIGQDVQMSTYTRQRTTSSAPVTPIHRSDSKTHDQLPRSIATSSFYDASDFYHQPRPVLVRNKSQRPQLQSNKYHQEQFTALPSHHHTPKYMSASPTKTNQPNPKTTHSYVLNKNYNNHNNSRLNIDQNYSSTNRTTYSSALNGSVHGGLSATSRGGFGVNTRTSRSDDFQFQDNDARGSYQSSYNSQGPRQVSLSSQYARDRDPVLGHMRQEQDYSIGTRTRTNSRNNEQHMQQPVSRRYQSNNSHNTSVNSVGGGLDGYISYDSLEYMKSIGLL